MKSTIQLQASGLYLIESLACARSCYFESEIEVHIFKTLIRRYMEKYVEIHKMYLSSEGYQILLRVRMKDTIIRNYRKKCAKLERKPKQMMVQQPWRVISEQLRQFKSLYVKTVNKLRGRKGVLVQSRYTRYYFESEKEYDLYTKKMEAGKEIESQHSRIYRVEKSWVSKVNWVIIRSKEWVESISWSGFQNLVVANLINSTLSKHSPPP